MVEPVSIAASAATLTITALRIIHYLDGVRKDWQQAPQVIETIAAECSVASTQLAWVQQLVLKDQNLAIKLKETESLGDVFSAVLGSLARIFSLIEDDVKKLSVSLQKLSVTDRIKFLWDHKGLESKLELMRRHQEGLGTLERILQTSTLQDIRNLLTAEKSDIESVAQETSREYAVTVYERQPHPTIDSESWDGVAGSEMQRFDFDPELWDTVRYRKELLRGFHSRIAVSQAGVGSDDGTVTADGGIPTIKTHDPPMLSSRSVVDFSPDDLDYPDQVIFLDWLQKSSDRHQDMNAAQQKLIRDYDLMERLLEKTDYNDSFGKSLLAQLYAAHLKHSYDGYLYTQERSNTEETLRKLEELKANTDTEIAEISAILESQKGELLYGPDAFIEHERRKNRLRMLQIQLERIASTTELLEKHLAGIRVPV